jgi:predicted nucleotide-binding protein
MIIPISELTARFWTAVAAGAIFTLVIALLLPFVAQPIAGLFTIITEWTRWYVDRRKVFVVCGRNQQANQAMKEFLSAIGLRPVSWNDAVWQTGIGSPFIGEILDTAFTVVQAVVVLLTPDDEAHLDPKYRLPSDGQVDARESLQPRQNVVFEAGMAFVLHRKRTVIVELGRTRPMSDLHGRFVFEMSESEEKRWELAKMLQRIGCPVDLSGQWRTAGDFKSCLPVAKPSSEVAE